MKEGALIEDVRLASYVMDRYRYWLDWGLSDSDARQATIRDIERSGESAEPEADS